MKDQKGVTTSSVIIYVIVVLIVLATLATISGYFHKQIAEKEFKENGAKSFTSFLSYFTEDIQEQDNGLANSNIPNQEITNIKFNNGNIYKYSQENQSIYKNDKKIAEDVTEFSFKINENASQKTSITVKFISGMFNKTLTFYPKGK